MKRIKIMNEKLPYWKGYVYFTNESPIWKRKKIIIKNYKQNM